MIIKFVQNITTFTVPFYPPLLLSYSIKAMVSPHQQPRLKSQQTICLSSSCTPRLMLSVLLLKAIFPKQIFPMVQHRGAFLKACGTHPKALSLCPASASLSEQYELRSELNPFRCFDAASERRKPNHRAMSLV